jgi:hypothetical protein
MKRKHKKRIVRKIIVTNKNVTEMYHNIFLAIAGQTGRSVKMMTIKITAPVARFDHTMSPEYIHVKYAFSSKIFLGTLYNK